MESLFKTRNIYTLREASAILRVSRVTLIRAIEKGQLRAFRVGVQWRILGAELSSFVNHDELARAENGHTDEAGWVALESNHDSSNRSH
jgi:excisionase family DNA binding protein